MESEKLVNIVVIHSRYTKGQVIVSLRVITKVFLLRHSNFSLENGKNLCVQCRKKIMHMPGEVPVEQSISSTSSEEELKSNDTT